MILVSPERLAEWMVLTNRWEIPHEFRAYRGTIERASKEDAFCLGVNSCLDAILPKELVEQARRRYKDGEFDS